MKFSIIVAIAENNVIGKDNGLVWHLSADMKHFKSITSGHTIVMGRKTFESIGRPLPNRRNIVLSRSLKPDSVDGCEVFSSIEEVKRISDISEDEEVIIIGGGEIYNFMMKSSEVSKLYVTRVHCLPEGDTFFPAIDNSVWKEVCKESYKADEKNDFDYDFIEYERI